MSPETVTPIPAVPPIPGVQSQKLDPSIPAKTTFQEDLVTLGQRKVNLVWEYTQSAIALMVIGANMVVGTYQGLMGAKAEYPIILSSSLFLVVGFYFSRTNHTKIGGVGQGDIGR